MSKPLKIFITYAHKDTEAKDELIIHLAVLKREGLINLWHDNEILPGDKWHDAIFSNLADSDILLYLTSAYSLASENCNKELAAALSADTKIRVIPIILDCCDWMNHQLSNFQVLPDKGKPITDSSVWKRESEGWQNVAAGIRKAIHKMQSQSDLSSGTSEEELRAELAFARGNIQFLLGQIDMAIEAYSEAIELKHCHPSAYHNRSAAYGEKGEQDIAIAEFNKAIHFKSVLAVAYYNRGIAYYEKGKADRAMEDYTKSIEIEPENALGYYNRGIAYYEEGEVDRAIEDYSNAIQLRPNDARFYNNRGLAYLCTDSVVRAVTDFNRTISLDPDYAEAYNNRGLTALAIGVVEQALLDLNKAIQLRPNDAMAYYRRTKAWFPLSRWEKIRSDLNAANALGLDIIAEFRQDYGSIANFEQSIGIQLPQDIAAMLTPAHK
ncbi:tetratricopeptide repeat protein [Candidatus Poribacteria bacterium]|nr:tetratricopeptide repeat protein [Candidatus Poribacteria bacterium]MYG06770.1 tetratricopeptide repeat protein [Candidatus Poribacteria bacterium]